MKNHGGKHTKRDTHQTSILQESRFEKDLGVSKNRGGPPKVMDFFIGFSSKKNHPFWGTTIFGNTFSR